MKPFFDPAGVMHEDCKKCGMGHDTYPRHPTYRLHENEDFEWEQLEWPCVRCGHAISTNCADAKL